MAFKHNNVLLNLITGCSQPIKTSCNQVSKTLLCLTAILPNSKPKVYSNLDYLHSHLLREQSITFQ